jgi:hypothetical protein
MSDLSGVGGKGEEREEEEEEEEERVNDASGLEMNNSEPFMSLEAFLDSYSNLKVCTMEDIMKFSSVFSSSESNDKSGGLDNTPDCP